MDNNIKIGSNRSFGIVFSIVFLLVSIYPLLNDGSVRIWSLIISFIFLILGLSKSNLLTPLNILWMKFGLLLGKIISPIIMVIFFFVVVTPIGIIMRVLGKNILRLKKNKKKSYWIKREIKKTNMRNQF
jgi:hypothetical protein